MKVFKLSVTDNWSTPLEFQMEIFFEDACADAIFKYKGDVDNIDVVFGADSKVITPIFELNNQNCQPTMAIATSESGASNYVAHDPTADNANDYIAAIADRSLTLASSVAGQLQKTIYFQLQFTIAGSVVASTEGVNGGMMTYEFTVTYLHMCSQNVLTRVGDTIVYKYFVETGQSHSYTPNVVSSVIGCALTSALSFDINNDGNYVAYDANTHAFVNSFDAVTGVLTVDPTEFSGLSGASADIPAKITLTDDNSVSGTTSVIDTFAVTLTNPCTAAEVSLTSIADVALTIQGIPPSSFEKAVPFSATVTDSNLEYCQIEYSLQVENNGVYVHYSDNNSAHDFIKGFEKQGQINIGG